MKQEILNLINEHQTIIIHRHSRPDLDAIGSQMGLYYALKENFPTKTIKVVGDLNEMSYKAVMDEVSDELFTDALCLVLDVSTESRTSDLRYKLAKTLVVIDHHTNDTDMNPNLFYKDSNFASACAMIADLFKTWQLPLNEESATYLYGGMVTDTGRFQFISNQNAVQTFELAAFVCQFNPDISDLYEYLYTESLAKRQTKQLFSTFELTPHNVAYRYNDLALIKKSGLDYQAVARGMIGVMTGIKEVSIWANFTEDEQSGKIGCELRSRKVSIVDIAKKYGGGGHDKACGCQVDNQETMQALLADLDERSKNI
jgi:phosphoesterase RecJ-like protein